MTAINLTLLPDPMNGGKLTSGIIQDDWIPGQSPVVSGVSGTFAQGNEITITGTNLSKARQTQLFYDDFSSGVVGESLVNNGKGWIVPVADYFPYVTDNTDPIAAGKKHAYLDARGDHAGYNSFDFITGIVFDQPYNEIYSEGWMSYQFLSIAQGGNPDAPQMKLDRLQAGTSWSATSANPSLTLTNPIVDAPYNTAQVFQSPQESTNDYGQDVFGSISIPPDGTWRKIHMAGKLSDAGVKNGWRYFKTSTSGDAGDCATGSWGNANGRHFASPNALVAKNLWRGEPWQTIKAPSGSYPNGGDANTVGQPWGFRRYCFPFFQRPYQISTVKRFGQWINDTAERVVVGTTNDLNNLLKTGFIQPNISRSNTSWKFNCETGNLPASGALYAVVVNRDRLESNIIQIRT